MSFKRTHLILVQYVKVAFEQSIELPSIYSTLIPA